MPIPADQEVRSLVARVSGYVKAHEILILAVFAVALIWGVSGKVQDVIAAHDNKNLILAQAQLDATKSNNAALAAQVAQQAAAVAAQQQETARLNAALEQANAALVTALAKQQATDKTLPPTALAQRIETLAALPPQSVVPQPDNTFKVAQPAAVQIAVTLENVPALQGQLKNAQDEKANTDKLLASTQGQVTTLNTRVDGLTLQLKQADGVCEDKIKVVKDDAAKSKRHWFYFGFVTGFLARQAIPHP
jgi:multidrug efflux pump subunit AcrA (membrane-fusion protein)